MIPAAIALRGEMTLRALARRRTVLVTFVVLPLALYLASHESAGRAIRALLFGITWAVSAVSFFASVSSGQIDPSLRLAGWRPAVLTVARMVALAVLALGLALAFWLVVAADLLVRDITAVGVAFAVAALVAVAFGTAVGAVLSSEMEGTLVLFGFAGLQAVVNPGATVAKLLPFWSSRELATFAVDGPEQGSLGSGLGHALAVVVLCGLAVATRRALAAARTRSIRPNGAISQ